MSRTFGSLTLLLLLCWGASLALPVATFGPEADATWPGWAVLTLGWLGVLTGQLGWLANFGFIACLIMVIRPRPPGRAGVAVAILTPALALHSLSWSIVFRNDGPQAVPTPIEAFHLGYYVWIATVSAAGVLLLARAFAGMQPATRPS